ncbi:MAG: hypothetical protein H3Z54_06945 [archaeon]|nr:hypothetical protein [archaeon]
MGKFYKLREKPEKCPECNEKLDEYMECPDGCGHWEENGSYCVWEQAEDGNNEEE